MFLSASTKQKKKKTPLTFYSTGPLEPRVRAPPGGEREHEAPRVHQRERELLLGDGRAPCGHSRRP